MAKWLVKIRGDGVLKARAHVWLGNDTVCRMWSTGGLGSPKNYAVLEERGNHDICSNCRHANVRPILGSISPPPWSESEIASEGKIYDGPPPWE